MKILSQHTSNLPENIRSIRRVTWFGGFVNLFLVFFKFFAGFFGNSKVLIADAVHSLSDMVTDFAVLLGSKYWAEPADENHPHGHAKIESLVTLFIGIALVLVGIGLIINAIRSIIDNIQGAPVILPGWVALIAALISILVKEYLYRVTVKVGVTTKSSAVIANAWHHRSDALSSIPAVIAVLGCMILGEKYAFLDPLGTVVVACMIIYAAWKIMNPTFAILLDAGASSQQCQNMIDLITSFDEVKSLHKLRTRRVGPSGITVDLHIQVDPHMSVTVAHSLTHSIKAQLLNDVDDVVDVLIHVEPK